MRDRPDQYGVWHYPLGRLVSDLGVDAWHGTATVAPGFTAATTASHYLIDAPTFT